MRKPGDIIAGLFFIILAIGASIGALKLHVGKLTEPQPGFFPFLGATALAVLSFVLLFQAFSGHSVGTQAFGNLWRPLTVIMGLVLYIVIFDTVGYIIATILISAIILRILDTKSWWVIVVVSLIIAMGSYILFEQFLGVPLPSKILTRFL
jgi:hypothetical protein